MAAPVGLILASLPWGTIIENAPAALQHARKLIESMRKREEAPPIALPEGATREELIDVLRDEIERQNSDLLALAGTVSELAELNQGLVAKVDEMRGKLRMTGWFAGAAILIAGALLAVTLTGG